MGEKCPFYSYNNLGTFVYIDCITNNCKLWDSKNERCGMKVSDVKIHEHNTHWHPLYHTCFGSKEHFTDNEEFYNICGGATLNFSYPKAAILISEYQFNEDLDGNGKVYGHDFVISSSDANKPPVLVSIENTPTWTDPACVITWQQYLDWLNYGNDTTSDPYFIGLCECS